MNCTRRTYTGIANGRDADGTSATCGTGATTLCEPGGRFAQRPQTFLDKGAYTAATDHLNKGACPLAHQQAAENPVKCGTYRATTDHLDKGACPLVPGDVAEKPVNSGACHIVRPGVNEPGAARPTGRYARTDQTLSPNKYKQRQNNSLDTQAAGAETNTRRK